MTVIVEKFPKRKGFKSDQIYLSSYDVPGFEHGAWKTWKVVEFKLFSFQAWKVMEYCVVRKLLQVLKQGQNKIQAIYVKDDLDNFRKRRLSYRSWKTGKVMEKVRESHRITKPQKRTNPVFHSFANSFDKKEHNSHILPMCSFHITNGID